MPLLNVLEFLYLYYQLIQCSVTEDCKRQVIRRSRWDDFTPELWTDKYLKHLRDAALPFDQGEFVYDPEKECFNFQEDYQNSDVHDDEFVFSCAKQLEDSNIKKVKDEEQQQEGSDISQGTSFVTPKAISGYASVTK